MQLQMMTLSQLPHFLRFSVRMLCLQVFFIAVFISSQAPFSYSDSTLFISDDSYLYVELPVHISTVTSPSGKSQSSGKQYNRFKRKAFFKLKTSFISKSHVNQISQICFTVPTSSHYVGNSNNSLSIAVLGSSFPAKHHKMMDSVLRVFLVVNHTKKKLLYPLINHFNLLKIITNHFSRPPPIIAIFYQTQMTRIIKHK
ncbi:hypothetical protein SAMN05421856_10674 [Chryseobacterium taichungense]|uniref:Uncharacterized protein n=1 Tax=Chryseobacterium taichungense TaxID=295069 RepID=A0A1H8AWE8_9FLAO|nr:hypothetical protein SAMN05421856_10674 [Chryseobacterium taichungense]